MVDEELFNQLRNALDWMRAANDMKPDGKVRGLLNQVGTRAAAEWHLDEYFRMIECRLVTNPNVKQK